MNDIFISYSHEDIERVRALVAILEANHLSVWWDRTIPAGKSYRQLIESAITDARCVVVLWTRHSIASKWVHEEADEGLRREILVPVLLDDVAPPLGFRSIQAANLTHWHDGAEDPAIRRLLDDIANVLPVKTSALDASTVSPPPGARTEPQVTDSRAAGTTATARRTGWTPKRLALAVGGALTAIWIISKLAGPDSASTQHETAQTDSKVVAEAPSALKPEHASPPHEDVKLVVVEPPPADYFVLPTIGRQPDTPLRLLKISEAPNQITDDADWWVGNGLERPTYEVPNPFRQLAGNLPASVPTTLNGLMVVKVIRGEPLFAIYGANFSEGRYLLAIDPKTGKQLFAFDFSLYEWPQDFERKDKQFIQMSTNWAQLEGNIIYVAHSHSTYARSSKGYNAYITAIRVPENRILWRSQPLVCNARNFLIREDAIICGYGFTGEPDFLYVLNKADGRVVQRVPVKSGPDDLVLRADRLYVRTYNTDYVFGFVTAGETKR
ncbi:MAG: toll/interleukin-1 receptor domain-containing protein [Propionivibrio sp.]|uniref:toll/interleukin-1 receptor domain-containing protein n=1 Tax=Propionivibrio sp. TaxID=2212460 RepID=UPI001A4E6498|nr:toll/interleukin-1 receptor domain-containing protein [Propionivibrio sp.]MBL8413629.1 toll/interleukin-1 receptor domain-containing protein [Propionivibrio sp.]